MQFFTSLSSSTIFVRFTSEPPQAFLYTLYHKFCVLQERFER
jgi:hypothetical protein